MSDEYVKQMAIAKCMFILRHTPVKIFRFSESYTVIDRDSNDKIFEIKPAEFCNSDQEQNDGQDKSCECLVINKKKFSINKTDNNLLSTVKKMYENQDLQKEQQQEDQPETLVFLDKYIHR